MSPSIFFARPLYRNIVQKQGQNPSISHIDFAHRCLINSVSNKKLFTEAVENYLRLEQ